jgi:phosphatidylserine synthase
LKLKDYVTLGNLLAGFLSVVMLIRGNFDWACYLIFIGYVFDVLDGPVARWTKQHDAFGGAFDSACDFVTYSICPSFIIYYAFAYNIGFWWPAAAAIGAVPVTFGTVRQARYATHRMDYPCYWIGLPRPVLSLFILAILQSSLFNNAYPSPLKEISWGIVIVLIVFLGFFHLAQMPFCNHHDRRWMGLLRFGKWEFLLGSALVLPFAIWLRAPWFLFDKLVFDMMVYVFIAWVAYPREDRRRIKQYLDGGEVELPLCHKDRDWRPRDAFPYFHPEHDERPAQAAASQA